MAIQDGYFRETCAEHEVLGIDWSMVRYTASADASVLSRCSRGSQYPAHTRQACLQPLIRRSTERVLNYELDPDIRFSTPAPNPAPVSFCIPH